MTNSASDSVVCSVCCLCFTVVSCSRCLFILASELMILWERGCYPLHVIVYMREWPTARA